MPPDADLKSTSFELREIRPGDNVTGLSLGHADYQPLKTFLERHAARYHENNITKTYVLVPEGANRVYGYISLICSELNFDEETDPSIEEGYRPESYPAIKIARLAIHKHLRCNGHGEALIDFAISMAKLRIMPIVGCRLMIVDSKPIAVTYYEKRGFTLLDTRENREDENPLLYIDLQQL